MLECEWRTPHNRSVLACAETRHACDWLKRKTMSPARFYTKTLFAAVALSLGVFTPNAQAQLNIQIDYTYDTENFLTGHQDRIDSFNRAVTYVNSFIGSTPLVALTSNSGQSYNARIYTPVTGVVRTFNNTSIAANTIRIYVGSFDMGTPNSGPTYGTGLGTSTRAGSSFNGTSQQAADWQTAVDGRNRTNYGNGPYSNGMYLPSYSTVEFNSFDPAAFYFGVAAPTVAQAGLYDFQTVAVRTILDALTNYEIGTQVAGNIYNVKGSNAMAAGLTLNQGNNTELGFLNNNSSTTVETGIVSKMLIDTALATGERRFLTQGDAALLRDSGWVVVNPSAIPEPSTYAAFAGMAVLGLAACRRRRK